MGMIKFRGETVFEGDIAHVRMLDNWNDSMAEYYPTISIYFFDEQNISRNKVISVSGLREVWQFKDVQVTLDEDQNFRWRKQLEFEAKEKEALRKTKGKRVRVVRGRKYPIGIEGVIFWTGENKYGYGGRAGVQLDDGQRIFVDMLNIETLELILLRSIA